MRGVPQRRDAVVHREEERDHQLVQVGGQSVHLRRRSLQRLLQDFYILPVYFSLLYYFLYVLLRLRDEKGGMARWKNP